MAKAPSEVCITQQGVRVCREKINRRICTTIHFFAFSLISDHGVRGNAFGALRQKWQLLLFPLLRQCINMVLKWFMLMFTHCLDMKALWSYFSNQRKHDNWRKGCWLVMPEWTAWPGSHSSSKPFEEPVLTFFNLQHLSSKYLPHILSNLCSTHTVSYNTWWEYSNLPVDNIRH